jgi:hypothetical protein
MATTVWPAQGTTLAIDETGTGTYTLINEITSLTDLHSGTVTQRKTTPLTGLVHTYAGTIPDNGEPKVELNFDPTDTVHRFIRDLKDTPANGPNNFKATYSTGSTASTDVFSANVSGFEGPNASDVEDNLVATLTLKVTGAFTTVPT